MSVSIGPVLYECGFKFAKETVTIFFWLGTWISILPSKHEDRIVGAVSMLCGGAALFGFLLVEELRKHAQS